MKFKNIIIAPFFALFLGAALGIILIAAFLLYTFILLGLGRGYGSIEDVLYQRPLDMIIELGLFMHIANFIFLYLPATIMAFLLIIAPIFVPFSDSPEDETPATAKPFIKVFFDIVLFSFMLFGGIPVIAFVISHYLAYFPGAEPIFLNDVGDVAKPSSFEVFKYLYGQIFLIEYIVNIFSPNNQIALPEINTQNMIFSTYVRCLNFSFPALFISIFISIIQPLFSTD